MKSKVGYKVQGVKGGNPTYKENVGYVCIFTEDNLTISVDAFEGYGQDYKRGDKSHVHITHDGNTLFEGTSKELIQILSSLKEFPAISGLMKNYIENQE